MNMSIEKMLSHVYEIEGLMLVTRRLGDENTPDVITNKIQRKVRELAEMCGVTLEAQPAATPAAAAHDAVEHLPEDDYDADETWQHDNGEEFKEVFSLNYEEPQHQPDEVPVADREPDEDISLEWIEATEETAPIGDDAATPAPPAFHQEPTPPAFRPAVEQEPAAVVQETEPVMINDEPVPEPDPEVLPEDDRNLPDITVEFIEAEDNAVPEPEEEMPVPPVPTDIPMAEDAAPAPIRVDEKLQRHLSRDIRKAFSLNDRFRFQRELFAGSASAMDTAIEYIEVMNSYGNAELHFYSQLHWDRDNETVKDFMAIVRNHFQQ
jgi:hypothetical protein